MATRCSAGSHKITAGVSAQDHLNTTERMLPGVCVPLPCAVTDAHNTGWTKCSSAQRSGLTSLRQVVRRTAQERVSTEFGGSQKMNVPESRFGHDRYLTKPDRSRKVSSFIIHRSSSSSSSLGSRSDKWLGESPSMSPPG